MPRKVRQLIADLRQAGFALDRQVGSHRQFKHVRLAGIVTVSGNEGHDAKFYQERQVRAAIEKVQSK